MNILFELRMYIDCFRIGIICAENEADLYKYAAEFKAEVYRPVRYESSSKIRADLLVQQEICDSCAKAYIVALRNITAFPCIMDSLPIKVLKGVLLVKIFKI